MQRCPYILVVIVAGESLDVLKKRKEEEEEKAKNVRCMT